MLRRQDVGDSDGDGRSIVDRAICSKPGWDLAGQLLYGDSFHRSNFVLTSVSSAVSAAMCSMQLVPPNGTTLVPTREAGLVQIAIPLAIRDLRIVAVVLRMTDVERVIPDLPQKTRRMGH